MNLKKYQFILLLSILCGLGIFFSGCVALLELGEIELGAAGLEVEAAGTLRLVAPEVVAENISSVTMLEEGELSAIQNGRMAKFAEVLENNKIVLKSGQVVKLPGSLYTVNEEVFVRQGPFNNSSILGGERYSSGRMVIVSDATNGWYEIMLPNHQFGFLPANSVSRVHSSHLNKYKKKPERQKGFHKGVNYIVNSSFINSTQTRDMIVNITYDDGSFDEMTSLKINSIAMEKGYRSTPSFFSKYYYIDELGNQLRIGNLNYINNLNLNKFADYLLIGMHSTKVRPNLIEANMLTSDLTYTLNLINLKTGAIEKSFVNTIHGNGWTDSAAREDALQSFCQIVNNSKF